MTNEEKRQDLQKRVDEARAYIRKEFQFEFEPRLSATLDKIEAVIAFIDFKQFDDVKTEEVIKGDEDVADEVRVETGEEGK